jgi:hypothetical protein
MPICRDRRRREFRRTRDGPSSVGSSLRRFVASSLLGVLLVAAPHASARRATVRGPWLLVSLAALGTVTWRCDTAITGLAPGLPGLALGFRVSGGQTGTLRLAVAHRTVVSRVIQPGQSIQLPYLHARVQRLEIAQGGENGTLRARVTVDFAANATSGYCWPYMPPKTDVQLFARR